MDSRAGQNRSSLSESYKSLTKNDASSTVGAVNTDALWRLRLAKFHGWYDDTWYTYSPVTFPDLVEVLKELGAEEVCVCGTLKRRHKKAVMPHYELGSLILQVPGEAT